MKAMSDVERWLMAHAARVEYSSGVVFVYWGDESEADGMTCATGLTLKEAVQRAIDSES